MVDLGFGKFLEILEVVVEDGEDVGIESMMFFKGGLLLGELVEKYASFEGEVETVDLLPRVTLHLPLLKTQERVLHNVHHAIQIQEFRDDLPTDLAVLEDCVHELN